jgi:hypothetical protein
MIQLRIIHRQDTAGIMNGTTCIINDNIKNKSPEVDHSGAPDFKAQEVERIPMPQTSVSLQL